MTVNRLHPRWKMPVVCQKPIEAVTYRPEKET